MKLTIALLVVKILTTSWLNAQSIIGKFPLLANQTIQLKGFKGFNDYIIKSITIDSVGNFNLRYQTTDFGMGFLISSDEKPFILILCGEDIELKGESLISIESIKIIEGQQNKWFEQYAIEQPKREQTLSAWDYLEKRYSGDNLFNKEKLQLENIQTEKKRIKTQDAAFLNNLPKDSYVKWFLPLRKLISSVSAVAQYRPEDIIATREALRQIDYADQRLYKSGLFKEAIENHVWFIENSSGELYNVYAHLNQSIDSIISQLKNYPDKFNEVTDYLFNLLEKRSLFSTAEYLSIKVLGDASCVTEGRVSSKLESYRAMKIGNVAPDIIFKEPINYKKTLKSSSLKNIESDLKMVVFAAGWCSHCLELIPKIISNYQHWQANGMEVILVTLDGSMKEYDDFTKNLPFITTSELKIWEGKTIKKYHIFATPSMFLLDKDLKIILKPISVEQVNSYLEIIKNQ
jgi:thiol-disulfide isomerase/thioredoxin